MNCPVGKRNAKYVAPSQTLPAVKTCVTTPRKCCPIMTESLRVCGTTDACSTREFSSATGIGVSGKTSVGIPSPFRGANVSTPKVRLCCVSPATGSDACWMVTFMSNVADQITERRRSRSDGYLHRRCWTPLSWRPLSREREQRRKNRTHADQNAEYGNDNLLSEQGNTADERNQARSCRDANQRVRTRNAKDAALHQQHRQQLDG